MTFKTFAHRLKPILSGGIAGGPFSKRLFAEITTYSKSDIDNPIEDAVLPRSYKAYYAGDRAINEFAQIIIDHCEPENFANYINSFEPATQDTIFELFKLDCPEMTPANIPISVGRLFYKIIFDAAKKAGTRKKKSKASAQNDNTDGIPTADFCLLEECHMRCSLCRERLIKSIQGRPVPKYKIVHIYPKDLDIVEQATFASIPAPEEPDDSSNLLLLCNDCAEEYLRNPTLSLYEKLVSIKQTLVNSCSLQESIDSINIEKGIEQILNKITELHGLPEQAKKRKWSAFCIDDKITNENFSLQDMVTTYVLRYYHFIDDLFKQLEKARVVNFGKVKHEVGMCFASLDELDLSQNEIFSRMVEWVKEKTGCVNEAACCAIISYFVQICEVFYEIT